MSIPRLTPAQKQFLLELPQRCDENYAPAVNLVAKGLAIKETHRLSAPVFRRSEEGERVAALLIRKSA